MPKRIKHVAPLRYEMIEKARIADRKEKRMQIRNKKDAS